MLRTCFPSSLCDALDELPETLDETYERILLGIEKGKREHAHRLVSMSCRIYSPSSCRRACRGSCDALWPRNASRLSRRLAAGGHPWGCSIRMFQPMSPSSMSTGHQSCNSRISPSRSTSHQTAFPKREQNFPDITFFPCRHIPFSRRPPSAFYSISGVRSISRTSGTSHSRCMLRGTGWIMPDSRASHRGSRMEWSVCLTRKIHHFRRGHGYMTLTILFKNTCSRVIRHDQKPCHYTTRLCVDSVTLLNGCSSPVQGKSMLGEDTTALRCMLRSEREMWRLRCCSFDAVQT
jgi:hypothetical protein